MSDSSQPHGLQPTIPGSSVPYALNLAELQAPKSQLCNVQFKLYLDCLESTPLVHTLGISQKFEQNLYIEFRPPSLGTSPICGFSPHFLTFMTALNSVFWLLKLVRLQGFV